MKKLFTVLAAVCLFSGHIFAYNGIWQQVDGRVPTNGTVELNPGKYLVFALNTPYITEQLFRISSNPASGTVIDLPSPDGSFRSYKIWERSNMEPGLAAKYPEIKSFTGYDINKKSAIVVLDIAPRGFHAMVLDGNNTYFIDPYSNLNDGYYLCYYKRDYTNSPNREVHCNVQDIEEDELQQDRLSLTATGLPDLDFPKMTTNGTDIHSYRLALACSGEYAKAVDPGGPTKPNVIAAMNTAMNRINGVYRSELSIEMLLVTNNDDLVFLDPLTDPYTNMNAPKMQTENQNELNTTIGAANYDIGHVFDAGQGTGIAEKGCVCKDNTKAMAVTGNVTPVGDPFTIDFVAHEMGHQFSATHTFNASSDQCGNGNGALNSAYEPGSGSTIMAYAGICGVLDNLQLHSDDYFLFHSLDQISDYITTGTGATCATTNPSSNNPASVSSVSATYYIPYLTPFELTAPTATDADHDNLTYCWEEADLGDFGLSWPQVEDGPIFRSFKGTSSETRIFPILDKIRSNQTNYLGEKLPSVERVMKFKLTVRDILNGWGVFNTPTDPVTLLVVNTGAPFEVTGPNNSSIYWQTGTDVTVSWNVANTNSGFINATGVDIFLSTDDGQTYPFVLAQNVPNTGTATVTVPANAITGVARVKVKGANNVFFDISNEGFKIDQWPASVTEIAWAADVNIYPVPAHDVLNISTSNNDDYTAIITNALGQQVWKQDISNKAVINISTWAAGVYSLQLVSAQTGEKLVRQVVVQ